MRSTELSDIKRSGVTERQYILGRYKEKTSRGLLKVGKYLAIDGSTGSDVYIDCIRPHAMLICGKRGYGKSYTMGTIVEELASQQPPVCDNVAAVVIDSMGIFWTMAHANKKESHELSRWGLAPKSLDIRLFVPGRMTKEYGDLGVNVIHLSIPVSDLTGSDWCRLFNISPVHPVGVLITRTVQDLKNKPGNFSLDDISGQVNADIHTDNKTKHAAINFISAAGGWGIFERDGIAVNDIVIPGQTTVIDISSLSDKAVRSMVVGILARRISQERIPARRQYEVNRIRDTDCATMPMVWMFIDEAHLFIPANDSSIAADVLVNDWLRQGRQPGLSLVLATQRPSALHPDVLSQSDIIMCHRLTSNEDITALEKVRPTYMRQSIAESIRKMGEDKGVAFIVDDTSEASHVVKMRPRLTWHGGDEPSSLGHNS